MLYACCSSLTSMAPKRKGGSIHAIVNQIVTNKHPTKKVKKEKTIRSNDAFKQLIKQIDWNWSLPVNLQTYRLPVSQYGYSDHPRLIPYQVSISVYCLDEPYTMYASNQYVNGIKLTMSSARKYCHGFTAGQHLVDSPKTGCLTFEELERVARPRIEARERVQSSLCEASEATSVLLASDYFNIADLIRIVAAYLSDGKPYDPNLDNPPPYEYKGDDSD